MVGCSKLHFLTAFVIRQILQLLQLEPSLKQTMQTQSLLLVALIYVQLLDHILQTQHGFLQKALRVDMPMFLGQSNMLRQRFS